MDETQRTPSANNELFFKSEGATHLSKKHKNKCCFWLRSCCSSIFSYSRFSSSAASSSVKVEKLADKKIPRKPTRTEPQGWLAIVKSEEAKKQQAVAAQQQSRVEEAAKTISQAASPVSQASRQLSSASARSVVPPPSPRTSEEIALQKSKIERQEAIWDIYRAVFEQFSSFKGELTKSFRLEKPLTTKRVSIGLSAEGLEEDVSTGVAEAVSELESTIEGQLRESHQALLDQIEEFLDDLRTQVRNSSTDVSEGLKKNILNNCESFKQLLCRQKSANIEGFSIYLQNMINALRDEASFYQVLVPKLTQLNKGISTLCLPRMQQEAIRDTASMATKAVEMSLSAGKEANQIAKEHFRGAVEDLNMVFKTHARSLSASSLQENEQKNLANDTKSALIGHLALNNIKTSMDVVTKHRRTNSALMVQQVASTFTTLQSDCSSLT